MSALTMSGRGRGSRSGYNGGGGRRNNQRGSTTGRSNKSKNDSGSSTNTSKQKLFQPHQVGNQHVDTFDSALEMWLTNVQKALVDGGLTVKAVRESDWKKAKPVKPTMDKINFRKRNENGELILAADDEEQCETDNDKMEQMKCEAKKIEHTEELRLHNDKPHQFEDDKEKAHSRSVEKSLFNINEKLH